MKSMRDVSRALCAGTFALLYGGTITFADGFTLKTPVIAPLSAEQVQAITSAIDNDRPLVIPPSLDHQVVRQDVSGVWAGSATDIKTNISEIVFRFGLPDGVEAGPVSSFDLNVSVGQIVMEFQHTAPKNPKDSMGFKMRVDPRVAKVTRAPFIEGVGNTSFNMIVPPFADPLKEWGFLVCPRQVTKTQTKKDRGIIETKYALEPSPFVLKKVGFKISGRGEAEQQTVGQKGFVGIKLVTSPQLPKSAEYEDRSVSVRPHPMVEYRRSAEFEMMDVAPDGSFAEGIGFSVTMQNQAGLLRRQFFTNVVYANTLEYTRDRVIVGTHSFGPDKGPCYLLAWREEKAATYSKEPMMFGPDAQAPEVSEGMAEDLPLER